MDQLQTSSAHRWASARFGIVRRRALTAILVAMTVLAITGSAATALTLHHGSGKAADSTVKPAAATTDKVLGTKLVKLTATGAGALATLINVAPVSSRAVCTDLGGGSFKVEVQAKSSVAGTVLVSPYGQQVLTGSFATAWTVSGTAATGFEVGYDALTPTGTFQHYDVIWSVHELGGDCVVRLTATSA